VTEKEREKIRELESGLTFLIRPGMTREEKIGALRNSWWRSHNTGYCDAMAGRLMGGAEDWQTGQWEQDCREKYRVALLLDLLERDCGEN